MLWRSRAALPLSYDLAVSSTFAIVLLTGSIWPLAHPARLSPYVHAAMFIFGCLSGFLAMCIARKPEHPDKKLWQDRLLFRLPLCIAFLVLGPIFIVDILADGLAKFGVQDAAELAGYVVLGIPFLVGALNFFVRIGPSWLIVSLYPHLRSADLALQMRMEDWSKRSFGVWWVPNALFACVLTCLLLAGQALINTLNHGYHYAAMLYWSFGALLPGWGRAQSDMEARLAGFRAARTEAAP